MKKESTFVDWLIEPILEYKRQITEDKEIKVEDAKTSSANKTIFRPTNFSQYIGQERVKRILKNYIEGTKRREVVFPHTLISGPAGTGKTTLAEIIATELQVKYNYTIGSNIESYQEILERITLVESGIVMLDEIHSLERNFAEKFYPLMEDFRGCGPFTLVGATTELGEILKNRRPFYDRFKIILELEEYTVEDLVKIAAQYKNRIFANENITKEIYFLLAMNCRGNPRNLIRLLEATIYFNGNISSVLDAFGIIENGLTGKDLKVLTFLEMNDRGVGLGSICSYLDTSYENYLYQIEPFLLIKGFLIRTKQGRKITDKGKEVLNKLGRS